MNNFLAFILSLCIAVGISLVPLNAYADSDAYKNVTLTKNQITNKDYFAGGETVTLSGTVNGDAYVAGGTVIVDGVVNGDLLVAGGTVTIRGKVTQDVRAAGGQITISGDVGRNITTVGGSVTIDNDASIQGSLTTAAGNVAVFAPIGKQATIGAGQVTIDTTINGDIQAGVGQLTLTPNARVVGNITYWSEEKALIDPAASISGSTTHNLPPKNSYEYKAPAKTTGIVSGINPVLTIMSFLAALVVGLVLSYFFPIYTQQTARIVLTKPLQSLGIGFLSMVLAPFVFVTLLITIIGIPLDLILLGGFMISIYLAKIFASIALGQKILNYFDKKATLGWILTLGLAVYYILTLIPIVGFVFWMIAGLIGLGAILIQEKQSYTAMRSKNSV